MPRIFKGSESTLRLLISKTGDYQALTGIKIKLYTTDIENAIEIIDGIQVCKNIAIITLAPRAFMGMEDGLINYIIDGATEDDVFHTERQSNYMLKSLSYINEDGVATQTMTIESNGEYRVTPNDGLYVNINVNVPDLNGSYDEGKTDGVNEQKSKLETINITENGTYSKEDGYNEIVVDVPDLNGDYNEGYEQGHTDGYNEGYAEGEGIGYDQGQADIAAKARVLDVTENGTYMSKFSDPIVPELVTGVYANGTDFYSYAELTNKVFNTNIPATKDSRIEFWYKNDATVKTYAAVIGGQTDEGGYIFKFCEYSRDTYRIEYGNHRYGKLFHYNFYYDTSKWNHIIFSKQDGLYVNDELICNVQGEEWAENETIPNFWINAAYLEEIDNNANGTFGMIKINDTIIIPTADGFLNTNTGELLEVVQNGDYTFTENLPIYAEGELYKTINVNVIPKINVKEAGIKFGKSTFTEVPEWADFNGVTDMGHMFSNCNNLQTIRLIDTSNATNMSNMFGSCGNLRTISLIDTSNVTDMSFMFANCGNLQTIPLLNTSNVENMYNMFYTCSNLQTIPQFNTSNVINMERMFIYCGNLRTLPELDVSKVDNISNYFRSGGSNLTDVGGWKNLKTNWNDNNGLALCPNLTYQSCINILNGLYDFVGNGSTETRTLKVHPNFLTTVGDKISIGTSKGWTITA